MNRYALCLSSFSSICNIVAAVVSQTVRKERQDEGNTCEWVGRLEWFFLLLLRLSSGSLNEKV